MSETWVAASSTSESWTSQNTTSLRVFSPSIFSNASHNDKSVFATGNMGAGIEGWRDNTSTSESWTAA